MSTEEKVTPYYIYDLMNIVSHYNMWKEAIKKQGRYDIIAYSVKANYDIKILEVLDYERAFFEVCSWYEYSYLLQYGIDPKRIIHNGPIACFQQFDEMMKNGSIVFLDSENSVGYALKYKENGKIGIRCNIDSAKKDSQLFYKKESRFGISNVNSTIRKLSKSNLTVAFLQAHCAGNNRSPEVYKLILRELCKIVKQNNLPKVEAIDIGGGYKIGDEFWNEESYVATASDIMRENDMTDIRLIYEPGNALVRTAASYVTTIIDKKQILNNFYLTVDGSKTQLPFIKKNIKLCYKLIANATNIVSSQIIVGSSCKESDVLLHLTNANELNIGDKIVISNVGAYSVNEISGFLIGMPHKYYM